MHTNKPKYKIGDGVIRAIDTYNPYGAGPYGGERRIISDPAVILQIIEPTVLHITDGEIWDDWAYKILIDGPTAISGIKKIPMIYLAYEKELDAYASQ